MMRYLKYFAIICLISFSSCEKEADIGIKDYPYVLMGDIEIKMDEYVTFNAKLYYNRELPILEAGFIVTDMAANPYFYYTGIASNIIVEEEDDSFSYTLEYGLIKNMAFSVRAFVVTEVTTVYSDKKTFISPIWYNPPQD